MAESIFKTAAQARQKDQAEIKSDIAEKRRIEKINLSIPSDYKERLMNYCDKNYISVSALLRQWIDANC